MGEWINGLWNTVSANAAAIQAVATALAAVIALGYLVATRKLWQETKAGNLMQQLEYSPDVFVSLEDPSRFGYTLVFSNQSRLGVVVKCDLFIDFADVPGNSHVEKTSQPVRHFEFNLPPGVLKKIPIDTFFELAKRGLGQYTPHRTRVEGEATIRSSQQGHLQMKQAIQEEFYCIMHNRTREFIPANELLNPDRWEWVWLIFNLSEKHTAPADQVEPWPEEKLPEEYRPRNNNTKLYMQKRLQNAYGQFFGQRQL